MKESKEKKLKPIIISLDDVSLKYGGWKEIKEFHKRNPKSKFTLFVIPQDYNNDYLNKINKPWTEIAFHGGHFERESLKWNTKEAKKEFLKSQKYGFCKGFKAPGWKLADAHLEACEELGFWIGHFFKGPFEGRKIDYWVTKPPWTKDLRIYENYVEYFSHIQYWDRSIKKLEEFIHNNDVEFKFISEAIKIKDVLW